jgi:hypothetical protein
LRFVEMLVGELRSVEEALVNGAKRARDSFRTVPRRCNKREECMGLKVLVHQFLRGVRPWW